MHQNIPSTLQIFTTSRQIRHWLQEKKDQFLPKYYTIGEFLQKIVVVDGKKFIDADLRKSYLFKAIRGIDVRALGIDDNFANFFFDSEFLLGFFQELFLERVSIEELKRHDLYAEYVEHLGILEQILRNYEQELTKDGYIDSFLIQEYRINEGLLEGIERIELRLDGYLSRFELEVLQKLGKPVFITFEADRFNKPLLEKSFHKRFKEGRYVYNLETGSFNKEPIDRGINCIDIGFFSERIQQVDFIFAKIAQFVKQGIDPKRIAVILPDESLSEYLALFDEYENLNFAMGESFIHSPLYILLQAIYDYKSANDPLAYEKCKEHLQEFEQSDLEPFVMEQATDKEKILIEQELHKASRFKEHFATKEEYLFFLLQKFKNLRFDDVFSGEVTVMGVLEGRGMEFDAVIVPDFNEEFVPKVGDNDLFLNSRIRKACGLPTRFERESLQKHYYYQLFAKAKQVAISYVKNDQSVPSRFLRELGLSEGLGYDEAYKNIVIKEQPQKAIATYEEPLRICYPLYPTSLKTLLECPLRYYFANMLQIQNETKEINFGSIFHESIKEVVRRKEQIATKEEYFQATMEKIEAKIPTRKMLYETIATYEAGIRKFCYEDFTQMKRCENDTEKRVEFGFAGHQLGAIVDRIDYEGRKITLIDYKTSKEVEKNEKYPYDFQTTFYYLYAKSRGYKDEDIKVYLWDIYNGKKIAAHIDDELLKEVIANLPIQTRKSEDLYIGDRRIKKATDICRYCDYKVACGRAE